MHNSRSKGNSERKFEACQVSNCEVQNIYITKDFVYFQMSMKGIFQLSFYIGHLGKERSVRCTKDTLRKI